MTTCLFQSAFDVRFDWGAEGARQLSSDADIVIVVDILSFSTCVDIGVSAKGLIYPFLFKDARLQDYATSIGAKVASPKRSKTELCLSPLTIQSLLPGEKLVLPSPNGSSICFSISGSKVLCGCLRNATAVAEAAQKLGSKILVVAAGEKWDSDQSLRPALEDLIGAGAILSKLDGSRSPEAIAAIDTFMRFEKNIRNTIYNCCSGQELVERGFPEDIDLASEVDVSLAVPILKDKCFVDIKAGS